MSLRAPSPADPFHRRPADTRRPGRRTPSRTARPATRRPPRSRPRTRPGRPGWCRRAAARVRPESSVHCAVPGGVWAIASPPIPHPATLQFADAPRTLCADRHADDRGARRSGCRLQLRQGRFSADRGRRNGAGLHQSRRRCADDRAVTPQGSAFTDIGESIRNGAQLAVDDINLAGGFGGGRAQADPGRRGRARNLNLGAAIATLIDANVDAIIGPASSTNALAGLGEIVEPASCLFAYCVRKPARQLSGSEPFLPHDPFRLLQATAIGEAVDRLERAGQPLRTSTTPMARRLPFDRRRLANGGRHRTDSLRPDTQPTTSRSGRQLTKVAAMKLPEPSS